MYDTIIIGRDLSSLIAALASSRHGQKTVLLTEGDHDLEHCDGGYAFPIDPTPLSGFGEDQTIPYLLSKLELAPDKAPKPLRMNPAIQVTLPGHRIDLFHDREQLLVDMIREFPRHERDVRRYYRFIDRAGALIERRLCKDRIGRGYNLGKMLNGLLRLPAIVAGWISLAVHGTGSVMTFRKVMEAQLALLSHLYTNGAPYPLAAAYLLSLPQRGVYYPLGGRTSWMKWLRKQFADAGGVLMDHCSVMRIDTKPEINVDVEKEETSTTLRGKRLIVSAQWEKLKPLLLQHKHFRRLVHKLHSHRPASYPFCLHLGVREEGLPEQLAPYTIWIQDETKPLNDRNLVYIQTSCPDEKDRAPQGRRALCAMVFLEKSPMMLTDLELSDIARGIIDSLEGLLPFLRENIDYVNIERSISVSRRSQEIITPKYPSRTRITTGITSFSPMTSLTNVFLTGGILRAGLGFEGEILAGMDAAFITGREVRTDGLY